MGLAESIYISRGCQPAFPELSPISGPGFIMPNGTLGPGKVLPPPSLPRSGSTFCATCAREVAVAIRSSRKKMILFCMTFFLFHLSGVDTSSGALQTPGYVSSTYSRPVVACVANQALFKQPDNCCAQRMAVDIRILCPRSVIISIKSSMCIRLHNAAWKL
jgi:hypothetical protein